MTDETHTDTTTTAAPTRRDVLTYGSAAAGAGLLAGCTGDGGDGSDGSGGASPTDTDDSYTVEMAPTGEVTFGAVPETVAPFTADYIDMLVALGHGGAAETIWYQNRYKTTHYEELPGVDIDAAGLTPLWNDGISKELLYEVDADLHLIDPHSLTHWLDDWPAEDIEEIETNVAPFLGNLIFRRTDEWHDYRYYTLYEAFEKVAAVFQERERFEAIRSLHDELVAEIERELPPAEKRPDAALVFAGDEPESFAPYRVSGKGANKEHFHTLGIGDAFADTEVEGYSGSESVDYETLLDIDPDSLLLRYHGNKTREEFEETTLAYMKEHDLGSQLTAVQEGRVFRGSPIYCGPLHNLFMLERYATAYFPERFDDELFDRQRVADIVNGGS
jgi:iron complex transport system substrate-binding protein